MSGIVRRLRRTNKKAAKYRFTAALQELRLAVDDEANKPETILVSFMHRRRKITSRERQWEPSFSKPEQTVIVWPEQAPEHVDILTTLYRSTTDDAFDDKEWTIVVEEINKKGKRRPIAAVSLNIRLFIMDAPDQRTQVKLKLRPLCIHLTHCSLEIVLSSNLVKEGFRDDISTASSISQPEKNNREISVTDGSHEQKDSILQSAGQEIAAVSENIKQWSDNSPDILPELREEKIKTEPEVSRERPPWRVTSTVPKEPTVQESLNISTEAFFKVNEKSQPVFVPTKLGLTPEPLPTARTRSHSPRAPSRERKLEKVEGEDLQAWAKRVTSGYYNVKLNDTAKCWQNGLALCAILHAYRSDLIDYDGLDFSDSMHGRKNNVKKVLASAQLIGLNDIPDESYILTPDKKVIFSLLERMRRAFEGITDHSTPTTTVSDHRISQLFPVSESEMKVIDEIRRMKQKREANEDEFVDSVHAKDSEDVESADEDAETAGHTDNNNDLPTFSLATPRLSSIRSSGRSISPSKQEQLRLKAKQMLENPMQAVTETNSADSEKRRVEARRLIQNAVNTPANTSSSSTGVRSNLNRSASTRSRTSLGGSSTDLRKIELVRPSVTIQSFKKRDPSPVLQRKQYEFDSPIIPAMGRPTQMLSDKIKQNVDAGVTAFDRVRRFGSMRGQELRESISQIAKNYGMQDPLRGSQLSLNEHATPTKKIDKLQWERDVEDEEGCQKKQEEITTRLADITQQADAIQNKIRETEKGSSEEEMLLETYLRLTEEKNSLVGQQEYFNIIENIRQVARDIEKLNKELVDIASTDDDDDYYKSLDEKERTDRVMKSYLEAIDRKEDLMKMLFATEEQLREDEERYNSLTLDRVSNFIRGSEGPLTASKRIMTWLRG